MAYTGADPVALAKVLTTFIKTAPVLSIKGAVVQGRTIVAGRGERTGEPAGQARAVRQAALRAAGTDGAAGERVERRAARSHERAGAGGEEETRGVTRTDALRADIPAGPRHF